MSKKRNDSLPGTFRTLNFLINIPNIPDLLKLSKNFSANKSKNKNIFHSSSNNKKKLTTKNRKINTENKINDIIQFLFNYEYDKINCNMLKNLKNKENVETLLLNSFKKIQNIVSEIISKKEKKNHSLINTNFIVKLLDNNYLEFKNKYLYEYKLIESDYYNKYFENYISMNFIDNFSKVENFKKHCFYCDNYAKHKCNNYLYYFPNKNHIFCKKCLEIYKNNKIECYCDYDKFIYITNTLPNGYNNTLFPCIERNELINEMKKCTFCDNELYLNMKDNNLFCQFCSKNFPNETNAIVYNFNLFETLNKEIRFCLFFKETIKDNLNCEKCNGNLYKGNLLGKTFLVCKNCKQAKYFHKKNVINIQSIQNNIKNIKLLKTNNNDKYIKSLKEKNSHFRKLSINDKEISNLESKIVKSNRNLIKSTDENTFQDILKNYYNNPENQFMKTINNSSHHKRNIYSLLNRFVDTNEAQEGIEENESIQNLDNNDNNNEIHKKKKIKNLNFDSIIPFSFNSSVESKKKSSVKNLNKKIPKKILIKRLYTDNIMINESITTNNNNLENSIMDNLNMNEYKIKNLIGSGSYANIYRVEEIKTGEKSAIKKLIADGEEDLNKFKNQINILNNLDLLNPSNNYNILPIYKYCIKKLDATAYSIYFNMPLCDNDWNKNILNKDFVYTEKILIKILRTLSICLNHMQKKGIAHRDIKPQNILILRDEYYLCDFDESIFGKKDIDYYDIKGTEMYMSPKLYEEEQKGSTQVKINIYKSDAYSLGCCFVYALTKNLDLIMDIKLKKNDEENFKFIRENIFHKELEYSEKFLNIIFKLITYKEDDRFDFIDLENEINNIL